MFLLIKSGLLGLTAVLREYVLRIKAHKSFEFHTVLRIQKTIKDYYHFFFFQTRNTLAHCFQEKRVYINLPPPPL